LSGRNWHAQVEPTGGSISHIGENRRRSTLSTGKRIKWGVTPGESHAFFVQRFLRCQNILHTRPLSVILMLLPKADDTGFVDDDRRPNSALRKNAPLILDFLK
jgi:hypothetical protein